MHNSFFTSFSVTRLFTILSQSPECTFRSVPHKSYLGVTEEMKQRNKKTVTRGNVTVRERYQVKTDFIAPTWQILLFYSHALGVEYRSIRTEDVERAVVEDLHGSRSVGLREDLLDACSIVVEGLDS